jgi:hypothetical protein
MQLQASDPGGQESRVPEIGGDPGRSTISPDGRCGVLLEPVIDGDAVHQGKATRPPTRLWTAGPSSKSHAGDGSSRSSSET